MALKLCLLYHKQNYAIIRYNSRLTLTLWSGGRGSGASSAPISTRQVEGRRSRSRSPLPPDISEPPLSANRTPKTGGRARSAAAASSKRFAGDLAYSPPYNADGYI